MAIILPVVVRDAGEEVEPEYTIDVAEVVHWREGVEVKGVRTDTFLPRCELFPLDSDPSILMLESRNERADA